MNSNVLMFQSRRDQVQDLFHSGIQKYIDFLGTNYFYIINFNDFNSRHFSSFRLKI